MMSGTAAAGGQADLGASGGRTAPGEGRFDVWAPEAQSITLLADGRQLPMVGIGNGWWRPESAPAAAEVDYGYLLDGQEPALPDPRSRRQPHGVHQLSRTFAPEAYAWGDAGWKGRRLAGGVVYELHLGTFTPEGTLDAAIGKLEYLVQLGVDFIELLPVNAFNGTHNWGYDGVSLVRRSGGVRWPGSLPALRGRRAPARAGRDPGCCLQPPGAQRELPAAIRALPIPRRREHLGGRAEPGRSRLRPGAGVHPGERNDVVRGLPRGRTAARRRARAPGHPGGPHPGGAGATYRRPGGPAGQTAVPGGRIRPERSAADLPAPRPRLRPGWAMERRFPPCRAREHHRRNGRLLRRLRHRWRAGQGAARRVLPRRFLFQFPRPASRPADRSAWPRPPGSW